jgi:hypothetical protein
VSCGGTSDNASTPFLSINRYSQRKNEKIISYFFTHNAKVVDPREERDFSTYILHGAFVFENEHVRKSKKEEEKKVFMT